MSIIAAALIIAQSLLPCALAPSSPSPETGHAYTTYAAIPSDETSGGGIVDPEPDPDPIDTSALEGAINDAENAKKASKPSTDGKDIAKDKTWTTQEAYNSLNASIKEAKNTLNDKKAAQGDIDAQTGSLKTAIKEFEKSLSYGTKPDDSEVPKEKEVVNAVYLKMDEAAADGEKHFAGEDSDSKYKTLSIKVKGKTVKLNGYFTTNLSDGVMYQTADAGSPVGEVALDWQSSDNEIATVSPDGLITPIADGKVTITTSVKEESKYKEGTDAPKKSVVVGISGQSAEYVSKVTIIDENGNSLSSEDDALTIIDGKNKFFQFYAIVTWHDPKTGKERTEDTRKDEVTSTIKWVIGGSEAYATINEDTGRVKSGEFSGSFFVQCRVTGGNGGETVKDKALVEVDTGEYGYKPAESLTLKVVYQEFPDKVVQEHKYSVAELAGKLGTFTEDYTILGGTRFGVIRASGYLFKDVLALEGVELDEVYQFRFSTADGYDNPITSKFLYGSGSRYYFPNWDIGSKAGARVVPPMLACESSMTWGESMSDHNVPLSEGTRYRLVFGALWSGASNSSYQIYFIKGITIVLTGAPPADNGKGDGNNGDKSGDKNGDKDKNTQNSSGTTDNGAGNGPGGGNGTGTGTGMGSGMEVMNGTGTASAQAGMKGDPGSGDRKTSSGDSKTKTNGSEGADNVFTRSTGARSQQNKPGGNWKVYEMISNAKSNVAPLDIDVPYTWLTIPIACSGMAAGGLSFFIGFRRRLL